jgi:hypothetical protein
MGGQSVLSMRIGILLSERTLRQEFDKIMTSPLVALMKDEVSRQHIDSTRKFYSHGRRRKGAASGSPMNTPCPGQATLFQ